MRYGAHRGAPSHVRAVSSQPSRASMASIARKPLVFVFIAVIFLRPQGGSVKRVFMGRVGHLGQVGQAWKPKVLSLE